MIRVTNLMQNNTMLSTLKGESLVLESCELGPAAATEGVAFASGPMVTRP